ncbi:MAG: phosphate/phosphite/phosphonate ABC transporter substrate-binding protein [Rhizobacter sp.]|nr:phosphate/phosphite/phosphonate ABC transporter substrate-binding protein [Rhizobacter sp.]
MLRHLCTLLTICAGLLAAGAATAQALRFGVLNQRSAQLIAQAWNPVLEHVSARSGVALELHIGKTAPDTTAMAVRGDLDFYYTNHLFTPERAALGWSVFGRAAGDGIRAAIVVDDESPVRTLADLRERRVVFPSPEAFVGYWVPMDKLLKAGIAVQPQFAGNQEGALAQLRSRTAEAAAVNARVLEEYARREQLRTRTLWLSEPFLDLALMASPRVPAATVARVRAAFIGMAQDPEGARILEASAALTRQKPPHGFVAASDLDYDNYRRFYRETQVRASTP